MKINLNDKGDVKDLFTVMIPIDTPTKNGRIYSREAVTKAIREFSSTRKAEVGFCFPSNSVDDLTSSFGILDELYIEDNWLCGHIKLLTTTRGNMVSGFLLDENLKKYVRFYPIGKGKVDKDMNVSDFSVIGASVLLGSPSTKEVNN